MSIKIDIEDYLSEDEIKQACLQAIKEHTKEKLGINETSLATRIAYQVVKKEHQKYIINYKEDINNKIIEAINKINLGSLFFNAFGWSSTGHKILKELLYKHSSLLENKLIKILK